MEVAALYAIGQNHPLVFLPSHKSNFDHLVLQYVLYQNELPPNHTAGGINMNFFPVGPVLRRSGVFFIRREFRDNEPYKFVLRSYIDYLLEKRFPLEWYIEDDIQRYQGARPTAGIWFDLDKNMHALAVTLRDFFEGDASDPQARALGMLVDLARTDNTKSGIHTATERDRSRLLSGFFPSRYRGSP